MSGEIGNPKPQFPENALARIVDTPELARAVPLLRPEVLHAVIMRCGLHGCGELLSLTTDEQLRAVFDLDLWKAHRAGGEEQFDAVRFCEWLEVLIDSGSAVAAERLARMDVALVVAGLSPNIRVFDPGVFVPDGEPTGADALLNAGRERGLHAEIGGYLVLARRPDTWEPIVELLLALGENHPGTFHQVMRGCRRLSHAGWERDGLDDLLSHEEQSRFDLAVSREHRRDRRGFLSPQQARAFLESARQVVFSAPLQADQVFRAYQRLLLPEGGSHGEGGKGGSHGTKMASPAAQSDGSAADVAAAVASVIDVLRSAGVLADASRVLLPSGKDEASVNSALNRYLEACAPTDEERWAACQQELAFLANALVAGGSVQGRPFSKREAMEAAAATCNLGLERWPGQWLAPTQHDLIGIFKVGWTILHREVSMVTAAQLLAALDQVRTSDRDLQLALRMLARQLQTHRQTEAPWRVRDQLDILGTLDLPVWAALAALLDECPVMLANVGPQGDRRPHTLDLSDFQFVAEVRQIGAIHEFLGSLPARLAG